MEIAALITWIITAGGGFVLLGTWLRHRSRAGVTVGAQPASEPSAASRLPSPVLFGHFLLAAAGLLLWLVYVANDNRTLGWVAFVLLLVVALLGFTMLARWIAGGGHRREPTGAPENQFPVPVVIAHGLFGAVTLVLVLLAAAQVGGS